MRVTVIITLILGLLAAPASLYADHSMVLIVNAESSIKKLKPVDLRKIYLGFTVTNGNGRAIHAVTNRSDARLWTIFLQDVMGMSERSYDRRLLSLTLQSGRVQPRVYYNVEQIIEIIKDDKDAIAFVWHEDSIGDENIKVLRVLWQH